MNMSWQIGIRRQMISIKAGVCAAALIAAASSASAHAEDATAAAAVSKDVGSGDNATIKSPGPKAANAMQLAQDLPAKSATEATKFPETKTESAPVPANIEEVEVSSTRIAREGFVAPTPETTLTTKDLRVSGYTLVGQAITDLPIAKSNYTPYTGPSIGLANQGVNIADLRGLGYQRTLELIDGMRPVLTTQYGFDLNEVPVSLLKRVDLVTGGASAAWGSDAVSGVINLVLDNDFVGERGNIQYGQNGNGYGQNYEGSAAFGALFGPQDRGHVMVGCAIYLERRHHRESGSPARDILHRQSQLYGDEWGAAVCRRSQLQLFDNQSGGG